MRARKPKHIQERLVKYSASLELQPQSCKGKWLAKHCAGASKLHVDLGCGKGSFVVESARRNPDHLYIGIDSENICIALAAQKAVESGLNNAIFVLANADEICDFFNAGEVDTLHLNFCTPRPKAKHAHLRLTYAQRLNEYAKILKSDSGHIAFKTDSQPYFDWSLTQFEAAQYKLENVTRDLHSTNIANVLTEYEARLSKLNAKIHACNAFPPSVEPTEIEQKASMSLGDYLPQDIEGLESLEYIPYGMEDFVSNKINWLKKHQA